MPLSSAPPNSAALANCDCSRQPIYRAVPAPNFRLVAGPVRGAMRLILRQLPRMQLLKSPARLTGPGTRPGRRGEGKPYDAALLLPACVFPPLQFKARSRPGRSAAEIREPLVSRAVRLSCMGTADVRRKAQDTGASLQASSPRVCASLRPGRLPERAYRWCATVPIPLTPKPLSTTGSLCRGGWGWGCLGSGRGSWRRPVRRCRCGRIRWW